MSRPRLRERLRYRFDNTMSKGAPAMIGLLGIASGVLVVALIEAARPRGETAIGYRLAEHAQEAPSYGFGSTRPRPRRSRCGTATGSSCWLRNSAPEFREFTGSSGAPPPDNVDA